MEFGYSAQDIADFLQHGLRFRVQSKDYAVTLLGLKGFNEVSPGVGSLNRNEPDLYNDILFALWHEKLSIRHYGARCTLEPGRYYTKVEPHPEGAPRLPECRLLQFKLGTHHGRPALVPADLDVVIRDADGNFKIDPYERVHVGNFQVRIHSGGSNPETIGKASAGCPAVFGGERGQPWQTLLAIFKKHPFERFNLVIGRGYDFYEWLLLKEAGRLEDFRATVHVGSRDGLEKGNVWKLQAILNERFDARLVADGDFGTRTLKAFLDAQASLGLTPKAICGPAQWERLQGVAGPYLDEVEHASFFE